MRFLFTLLPLLGLLASAQAQSIFHPEIMQMARATGSEFPFGVASGDPEPKNVLLWTKVLPPSLTDTVEVNWVVATDTTLKDVVGGGKLTTNSASAFTVQIEQQGLEPSTTYFYCFFTATDSSAIGRTRTASQNGEDLRFAVASCANYQTGYFNAYGHMAKRNDINAILFLGDYIYEYGTREDLVRLHIPATEILTLEDYRSRYAQYRLDADLMEAHRLHPFITIWDDHEFANNTYVDGADNHQDDEDDWEKRKGHARQAFYEWIPVRRQAESSKLYRSLNYGSMAELFMIDGRVEGRSIPVEDFNDVLRYDTARTMLGATQRMWLKQGLSNSKAHWRVLVNDVMFAPMDLGKMAGARRYNMDAWDGYEGDRSRILDIIENDSMRNLVVVTGDIHTAWGIDVTRNPMDKTSYNRRKGNGVLGAEFVTSSISSPNLDEMRGKLTAKLAVPYIKARKRNPHLYFLNAKDHGYMLLELTEKEAKCTWVFMKSILKPSLKIRPLHSLAFPHNGRGLEKRNP
ncbi:MAG: alkaline phosphatase D family protein [Flavobacteriales bacterium]|nr:alkaline phosphatase D family protein [Flavobacteriales bacterium]